MFKSLLLAGLAATFFSVAGAAPAEATELDFTLTDSDGDYSTWTLPSSPIPAFHSAGTSDIQVSITGSLSDVDYLDFRTTSNQGGFTYGFYRFDGPQIFSGTTAAPTFAPGVFDMTNSGSVNTGETAVLTITDAAVPEPATWAMMLVGLGVIGAVARRRQNIRVTYA